MGGWSPRLPYEPKGEAIVACVLPAALPVWQLSQGRLVCALGWRGKSSLVAGRADDDSDGSQRSVLIYLAQTGECRQGVGETAADRVRPFRCSGCVSTAWDGDGDEAYRPPAL
ncbi:hypothetical protein AAHC03_09242 [Spirometra sp. Aus1]